MSLKCTKTHFIYSVLQKISDALSAMLGIGWKRTFNVLQDFFVILNFNVLCVAYAVSKHYIVNKKESIISLTIRNIYLEITS